MNQFSLKHIVLSLFVVCVAGRLQSQDSGRLEFFNSDEILEITLETDFKNLIKEKREGKFQPANLFIGNNSYSIRIKTRGHYRLENCGFPPISLNFSKTELKNNSDFKLKKLKLYSACRMQNTYVQYILREYQIYRAFSLMTDKSFKVRLLKINYVDTSEKMKPTTQYGFVLEEQKMMAERYDGMIIKRKGLRDQVCNMDQMIMLSIFQFMIGNTDWQVANLQNIRLVKLTDISQPEPYPVPYDFDYTGMVNASYAIPAKVLGIASVRERLYWGKCYPEEDLMAAIEKFYDNKEAIYQLYQDFTLFDKGSLKGSVSYLDSFYKIIEDEKKWKHYFIDKCRN